MRTLITAVLITAICAPVVCGRTWTDSTGKHTVEAEFVALKDGKVQLRKPDGKVVAVPIEKLGQADQEFVRSQEQPAPRVGRNVPHKPLLNDTTKVKSFEGYLSTGIHRAKDGKEFALFLDSKRSVRNVRTWEKEDSLLKAVSQDSGDLAGPGVLFRAFNKELVIEGKKADDMLVIGVYPRMDIPAKGSVKNPVTFASGPVKTLNEVIRQFGEPTEKEVWTGQACDGLGLDGVVHWWGHVGVSASAEGSITHVLVREKEQGVSGK